MEGGLACPDSPRCALLSRAAATHRHPQTTATIHFTSQAALWSPWRVQAWLESESSWLEPSRVRQRDGGKARGRLLKRVNRIVTGDGWNGNGTLEFYKIGPVIGEGAFGKVRMAVHLPTMHRVAVKSYCSSKMKSTTVRLPCRLPCRLLCCAASHAR